MRCICSQRSAFNALLKTLEEPPEHVKFIFATTEIRKIPITILSRCQRFDLKRVKNDVLTNHFVNIASNENVEIEKEALELIAKASEGSVRDGLSLLDQAIASSEQKISLTHVQDMLGLSSQNKIQEIVYKIAEGDIASVFHIINELYEKGADPLLIAHDIMEMIHEVTKVKLAKADCNAQHITELAQKLTVPYLSRIWQMLIKGSEEIKVSPNAIKALEMLMVRVVYISSLPDLETLLQDNNVQASNDQQKSNNVVTNAISKINSYDDIIQLCFNNKELVMYHQLVNDIKFVGLADNNLQIALTNEADKNVVSKLQSLLSKATNKQWVVQLVEDNNQSVTIHQQMKLDKQQEIDKIKENELVKEILKNFTGSKIAGIKTSVN